MSLLLGSARKRASSAVASSFSGTFATTAATNTITSATRTYTLGSGNSGTVQFTSVVIGGSSFAYSKNGGSYVGITEGLTVVLANTDTLNIRGQGMTPAGTSNTCNVLDYDTGTVLENTSLTRS